MRKKSESHFREDLCQIKLRHFVLKIFFHIDLKCKRKRYDKYIYILYCSFGNIAVPPKAFDDKKSHLTIFVRTNPALRPLASDW